jgi:putative hydrolase of the HAD superfamily
LIKAILFDLDDTIIIDETVTHEAFHSAAALSAPLGLDIPALVEAALRTRKELWEQGPYFDYCDRIGHGATEGLWARYDTELHPAIAGLRGWVPGYRLGTWRAALAEQGVTDEALAAAMAQQFDLARRKFPRFPEIDPLLDALTGRYRLGIVTNGVPDMQREKLAGSGVAHRFDAAVISGEIDCGKPDPGIFRHICAELGVELSECIMIGDNPARDVAGAIAAGMRSVWVQRNNRARDERFQADLDCTDLSVVLPWLAQITA